MAKIKRFDEAWGYYTKLFHQPMQTPMWIELDAYDVFVYTEMLSKRVYGIGENPDTYVITPTMLKGRISPARLYKAISNLIVRGFIEITEHGGIGAEGVRRANVYKLSTQWQHVLEKRKENPKYLLTRQYAPRYKPNKKGVNTRLKKKSVNLQICA